MATKSLDLHPPTGLLRADHVELLASVSLEHGGQLELSGNGGIRISVPAADAERLVGSGLIDSTHGSPVPRVLCSPLTGRIGGHLDVRALAVRLEEELRRADVSAAAPAVVGVDDGTGDVGGLGLDLVFAALDAREFAVLADGADSGVRLRHNGSGQGGSGGDGFDQVALAQWLDVIARHRPGKPPTRPALAPIPIGWLDHPEGGLVTLGAAVAGGVLEGRQLQFLAALERPVVITPWRTLLLCDLDEWAAEQVVRVLAPLGFVFDAESPILAELGVGDD